MSNRIDTRLGEVAEFINGGAWGADEYADAGIPVVRVSDIADETVTVAGGRKFLPFHLLEKYRKNVLREGDVVVATVGSHPSQPASVAGRAARMPRHAAGSVLNQNAVCIRPSDERLERSYLRYVVVTPAFKQYVAVQARGTANQVRMAISSLANMPLRLPSPSAQRRVASVLSAYDDLIENNTRRIKILEDMAQMIYREWFVNFRFPGHENVPMVNSELGPIPEAWRSGRLEDALVLQRGFDLPTSQRLTGNVPVVAATGFNGTHNVARVKAPGVVTGRSGSLGTVMLVWQDFWPLNTALWVKEFKRSNAIHAFFTLKAIDLKGFNSGAAVPTLNRNDIHGLPIVLPNRETLDAFNECVLPMFVSKGNLEAKNGNLRKTRDFLLPKLISGEVPVEAAAELVEQTA